VADESGDGKEGNGDDGREVTKSETLDDVSGSTSSARKSDILDWSILVRSVVLSDVTNNETRPETAEAADPSMDWFSLGDTNEVDSVGKGDVTSEPESRGSEKSRDEKLNRESSGDAWEIIVTLVMSKECSDQRDDDTESSDQEGIVEGRWLVVESGRRWTNNKSGTSGFSERTEEIWTHTGNITNIVTDVVSNSGWIVGGVFREVALNFSDEISTDISSCSEDTTTNSSEESDSWTTKTVSCNAFIHVGVVSVVTVNVEVGVDGDQDGEHQETKTGESESHNASSSVSNWETSRHLLGSFESGSVVGENGNTHTDETSEHGGEASEKESNSGPELAKFLFDGEENDEGHEDGENKYVLVLLEEEGVGTLFNVRGDLFQEENVVEGERFSLLVVDILSQKVVFNFDGGNLDGVEDGVDQTYEAATSNDNKINFSANHSALSIFFSFLFLI